MSLETEHRVVKPEQLVFLKKNARYMNAQQFQRLKDNIGRDGQLTSTPLVVPMPDGRFEILSGNHRTKAAIEVGLTEIPVIVITTPLTLEQRTAIQLSHNAVTGQDDPNELHSLYEILSMEEKEYSGLTDDDFKIDEMELTGLSVGSPKYEELQLLFLPEDRDRLNECLKEIGEKSRIMYSGRTADFDALFDALVKGKQQLRIFNSAIAFLAIAELALKELNRMAEENDREEKTEQEDTESGK